MHIFPCIHFIVSGVFGCWVYGILIFFSCFFYSIYMLVELIGWDRMGCEMALEIVYYCMYAYLPDLEWRRK